jgi:hypothetical protein
VIEEHQLSFEQCEWQDFLDAKGWDGQPYKKWDEEPGSTVNLISQWEELLTERVISCCVVVCLLRFIASSILMNIGKSKWERLR